MLIERILFFILRYRISSNYSIIELLMHADHLVKQTPQGGTSIFRDYDEGLHLLKYSQNCIKGLYCDGSELESARNNVIRLYFTLWINKKTNCITAFIYPSLIHSLVILLCLPLSIAVSIIESNIIAVIMYLFVLLLLFFFYKNTYKRAKNELYDFISQFKE